jgi:putative transcriptional regulator
LNSLVFAILLVAKAFVIYGNGDIEMKIGEVIKKYRKQANLTQEQIANFLGVTSPAVNKWENGNSYPDITLLAPLARLLNINMDTLLSFREELTDTEINQIVQDLSVVAQKDGFIKAFEKGEMIIKDYPCCELLILSVAQILSVYFTMQEIDCGEKYEKRIYQWYEMVVNSSNPKVVAMATVSLVGHYTENKEYDRAQQLLDKIPPIGYDKRRAQAMIYYNQGKREEAYEIYEQLLYQDANELTSTLHLMIRRMIQNGNLDKIPRYIDIAKQIAQLFELGSYIEYSPDLFLAIAKKEKDRCLDALDKMISGMDHLYDYSKSELYTHMKFNEKADSGLMKDMIKKGLESDESLEFLKGDLAFQKLINKLE